MKMQTKSLLNLWKLCQTEILAIAEQQATAAESSKSNSHMRKLAPCLSAHRSRPRSCRCLKSLMWREQSVRTKQRGRRKNAWTDFTRQVLCWMMGGGHEDGLLEAPFPDLLSRMSPRPWALRRSFKRVTSSFSSRTSLALGSSLITALHLICLARSAYL